MGEPKSTWRQTCVCSMGCLIAFSVLVSVLVSCDPGSRAAYVVATVVDDLPGITGEYTWLDEYSLPGDSETRKRLYTGRIKCINETSVCLIVDKPMSMKINFDARKALFRSLSDKYKWIICESFETTEFQLLCTNGGNILFRRFDLDERRGHFYPNPTWTFTGIRKAR